MYFSLFGTPRWQNKYDALTKRTTPTINRPNPADLSSLFIPRPHVLALLSRRHTRRGGGAYNTAGHMQGTRRAPIHVFGQASPRVSAKRAGSRQEQWVIIYDLLSGSLVCPLSARYSLSLSLSVLWAPSLSPCVYSSSQSGPPSAAERETSVIFPFEAQEGWEFYAPSGRALFHFSDLFCGASLRRLCLCTDTGRGGVHRSRGDWKGSVAIMAVAVIIICLSLSLSRVIDVCTF